MKKIYKPLILLALIMGLGVLAYWDEWQTKKDKKEEENKNKLFTMNLESLQSLTYSIQTKEGETLSVELVRGSSGWQVKQPFDYPADGEGIDRWVKTIAELQYERVFPGSGRLGDFGLDKPKIEISMNGAENQKFRLRIGEKTPTGFSSYAATEDDSKVYVVNHYVFTSNEKEVRDFLDKTLQIPTISEIRRIEVKAEPSKSYVLERTGQTWEIVAGSVRTKADSSIVMDFFSQLSGNVVEKFIDESTKSGAEEGVVEKDKNLPITWRISTDKISKDYALGEREGVIHAKIVGSKLALILDKKVLNLVNKSKDDFLDRRIIDTEYQEITKVVRDKLKYERRNGDWYAQGSDAPVKIEELNLEEILAAKFTQEITPQEVSNLSKQSVSKNHISLWEGDRMVFEAQIWPHPIEKNMAILERGDGMSFIISQESFEKFFPQKPSSSTEAK